MIAHCAVFGLATAGQALLAGWCIWDSGYELNRSIWHREHEKGSLSCCEVSRERRITKANYFRGVGRAERSLPYSALLSSISWAWKLNFRQYHLQNTYPKTKIPFFFSFHFPFEYVNRVRFFSKSKRYFLKKMPISRGM